MKVYSVSFWEQFIQKREVVVVVVVMVVVVVIVVVVVVVVIVVVTMPCLPLHPLNHPLFLFLPLVLEINKASHLWFSFNFKVFFLLNNCNSTY